MSLIDGFYFQISNKYMAKAFTVIKEILFFTQQRVVYKYNIMIEKKT